MCEPSNARLIIALGVVALFGVITFALVAATLGTLNRQYKELKNMINLATTTTSPSLNSVLAESIRIEDLMSHLKELQNIADRSNDNRAIGTIGFNATVDYIFDYLTTHALNLNVSKEEFFIRNFSIKGTPTLTLSVNGTPTSFFYSNDLAKSDFTYVNYSNATDSKQFNLTSVPNYGCNDSDWQNVTGRAALVIAGGTCTYAEKGELANKYNATALLFYNNGLSTSSLAPVSVRLRQANALPALFLSYATGNRLLNESKNANVSITIKIELEDYPSFAVNNICADTKDGNNNETIVIGSHSDGVPAGPGINDNGSGTVATLILAINLARLYAGGNYNKYRYRVRFCWWGAEEIGLAGSIYHVQQAQNTSNPFSHLSDYLINLNYDMLASPNYLFGIYNGSSAKSGTPQKAIPGSVNISTTFRNWFDSQNLPCDYTDFSGRSDYGPFLAAGIVAGGLFSGADETKTMEQRSEYELKLGKGRGGFAGAILDPCYHRACDTVDNIDQFAYVKMVQAAAYILEYLGRKDDLVTWLYPEGRPQVRLPDDYFPNSDYYREVQI